MRLRIALDKNWEMVTYPNGSFAVMRKGRSNNNALQLSFAENVEEKRFEPAIDLRQVLQNLVAHLGGRETQNLMGQCSYGQFASAIFTAGDFPYCQAWCSTNGIHVINATFICDAAPLGLELQEVEKMVMSLSLSPASIAAVPQRGSRWQFWKSK